MNALDAVSVLVLLQYIWFAVLVGKAREQYGVKAPAVTGHEMFERYYRVQMNTLELLVPLLPAMYLAARYWPALWVAGAGIVFMAGRFVYLRSYTADPKTRSVGFALSILPVLGLLVAVLAGVVMGR